MVRVGGEEVLDEGGSERAVCARDYHCSGHCMGELRGYRCVLELLKSRGPCLVGDRYLYSSR